MVLTQHVPLTPTTCEPTNRQHTTAQTGVRISLFIHFSHQTLPNNTLVPSLFSYINFDNKNSSSKQKDKQQKKSNRAMRKATWQCYRGEDRCKGGRWTCHQDTDRLPQPGDTTRWRVRLRVSPKRPHSHVPGRLLQSRHIQRQSIPKSALNTELGCTASWILQRTKDHLQTEQQLNQGRKDKRRRAKKTRT